MRTATGYLHGRGVPDSLLRAVHDGLRGGGWDDAVAEFAATVGAEVVFYLGPIVAGEGSPAAMGLVLGRRDLVASRAFTFVRDNVDDIGRLMFGFPCTFRGRVVEFFELEAAAGGSVGTGAAPIALFYFGCPG